MLYCHSIFFIVIAAGWYVLQRMSAAFAPTSSGAALVTACEASAVRVAMPTLLDEAMQTAMKSVTDLQKGHAHSLPRAVEH